MNMEYLNWLKLKVRRWLINNLDELRKILTSILMSLTSSKGNQMLSKIKEGMILGIGVWASFALLDFSVRLLVLLLMLIFGGHSEPVAM
jgi:hypothetical protein